MSFNSTRLNTKSYFNVDIVLGLLDQIAIGIQNRCFRLDYAS